MNKLGFSAETTSKRLVVTILFDEALQFIFRGLLYRLGIPFGRILSDLNCRSIGRHRYRLRAQIQGEVMQEMLAGLLRVVSSLTYYRDDDYFPPSFFIYFSIGSSEWPPMAAGYTSLSGRRQLRHVGKNGNNAASTQTRPDQLLFLYYIISQSKFKSVRGGQGTRTEKSDLKRRVPSTRAGLCWRSWP